MLWGFIFLYIIIFGVFTSLRQYNFQTQTGDMGIFVQNMWNTAHGRIMQNTLEELPNHFAIHWSPFLLLLAPLYRIFQSPYFLLMIQTIAIALGALPLYALAKYVLRSSSWALVVASAYLLYPSLQWANTYDFHEIAFLPTLLLGALYCFISGRTRWAAFFFILAAATKEDAILVVAFAGIWLTLRKGDTLAHHAYSRARELLCSPTRKRNSIGSAEVLKDIIFSPNFYGSVITVAFLFYFLVTIKLIMPTFGGGLLRIDRYAALGSSFGDIAKNLLTHPRLLFATIMTIPKLQYLFWVFAPVAFVPLFAPSTLILLVPGLLENLLTTFQFQFQGLYQYDSTIVAGIFVGVVYGLHNIRAWWPKKEKIVFWIFLVAMAIGYFFRSPLNPWSFPTELFKINPHWEALRTITQDTPPTASVAANTNLVPHLAEREHIYMLGREPAPVDIVLIDGADLFGFKSPEEFQSYADHYAFSNNYEIRSIQNRYFIFVRKKSP